MEETVLVQPDNGALILTGRSSVLSRQVVKRRDLGKLGLAFEETG